MSNGALYICGIASCLKAALEFLLQQVPLLVL